ncbi:MAG: hypothetical protein ABI167_11325 [Nitrosospira sp.]
MDAKSNLNDPVPPIPPPLGAVSNIVQPANALYGLRKFYESGEMADDEENEVELMIQLNGMVYYPNTENNE